MTRAPVYVCSQHSGPLWNPIPWVALGVSCTELLLRNILFPAKLRDLLSGETKLIVKSKKSGTVNGKLERSSRTNDVLDSKLGSELLEAAIIVDLVISLDFPLAL